MNTCHLKTGWAILFLFVCTTFLTAQPIRGLHVNEFKYILGDEDKENQLLEFAELQGFNYLLLYNLGYIHRHICDLTIAQEAVILANFIQKAKEKYGMKQVGAVGEKYASFVPYFAYNERYAEIPNAQLDVFSLEFEFWNKNLYSSGEYYCTTYLQEANLPCTQDGAFLYYEAQLKQINDLVVGTDIKVESYIGRPTEEQCTRLARLCDRVLVHYYRDSDTYDDGSSIYNYDSYRLPALAAAGKKLDVIPLFNSRRQFMYEWLAGNRPEQAFSTFLFGQEGFNQQEGEWKQYINIVGYHWYRYTDLEAALNDSGGGLTATNNLESQIDIKAFPNPVTDELNLTWQASMRVKRIQVYSRSGQNVFAQPVFQEQRLHINTRDFPKGLLVVVLETEEGLIQRKIMCN